jgi:uncharacterized protein YegL
MTDISLTHLYFLLDRSGSMQSIRTETVSGFNAFVAEQRKTPGKCRITLAQFDNQYEEVCTDLPIEDFKTLELEPRGSTALLDSIGRLITTAGERLAALPESKRPGTVIVGIMTDGMENASVKYRHADIKAMIEHQTKAYSWQFLYLGADQDAIEVGAQIGVSADHAMRYSKESVDAALRASSESLSKYRAARAAGEAPASARKASRFTDEQRKRAGG